MDPHDSKQCGFVSWWNCRFLVNLLLFLARWQSHMAMCMATDCNMSSSDSAHLDFFPQKTSLYRHSCNYQALPCIYHNWVLMGLDNFLYSWGLAYLPLSSSSLNISPQLGFNAFFAFLLVKQKFSSYSINALILLTMGAVLLAFHASSDRPQGVTARQYWLGFFATGVAASLYGFILPLIELVYKKTKCRITYALVMEMQLIMSSSATIFCTIGMITNKDFQAVGREARSSDVGEFNYYMSLVWNAICWQLFFIGVYGVIFLTTSLLSAIFIASLTPMTEVLAVVIFHEKFTRDKGMTLVMALWGFTSYLYGEYKNSISQTINMPEEHRQAHESVTLTEAEEPTLELVV